MNNTLMLIIGIAVVVAGAAYLLFGSQNSPATNDSQPKTADEMNAVEEKSETEVPENFVGNLEQLFSLGANLTCTFKRSDENGDQSGTVYISQNRMRGEFAMKLKEEAAEMQASMIQKDDTIYTWGVSPFGNFATKIAVDEKDEVKKSDDQSIDFDEDLDYSCSRWSVDESKFTLPVGVEFTDLNQAFGQIQQNTLEGMNLQCSACEQIPDANAQAQCRAALGC